MAEIAVGPAREEQETVRANSAADVNQQSGIFGRHLGFVGVFAFTMSSIGLAFGGMNLFTNIVGTVPGLSLPGMIGVALVVTLLQAYLYSIIGTMVPRFGADYLLSSRVLGGPLGFAASWVTVLFLSWLAGVVIASIPLFTLPDLTRLAIILTEDKGLIDATTWFSSPNGIVLFSTIFTVIIFGLLILPPRINRMVFLVGLVLLVIACAILYFQLGSVPQGSFEPAWNAVMGDNQYQEHFQLAGRFGMRSTSGYLPVITAGLLFSFWLFTGYTAPVLAAGEVKDPGKNLVRGSGAAILFSGVLLMITTLLLQRLIPPEWLAAESFLAHSPEFVRETNPWLVFYSAILRPNLILIIVLGTAWIFTILHLAHALLYAVSRVVYTWAQDAVLPDYVGFAHPSLRSPLIAVLVVCTLALVGVVDVALSMGQRLVEVNSIMMLAMIQVIPAAAVMVLPFRKPEWFKATAPAFIQKKLGPVPLASLVGLLSLIYLGIVITLSLQMRGFASSGPSTLLVTGMVFVSGLAWFFGRRYFLVKQGRGFAEKFERFPEE